MNCSMVLEKGSSAVPMVNRITPVMKIFFLPMMSPRRPMGKRKSVTPNI